jgi:colicin import membrane protein
MVVGRDVVTPKLDKTYRKPIAFSVILHLLIVVAMLLGWETTADKTPISAPRHINAVVVEASSLPSEKRKVEEKKLKEKEAAEKQAAEKKAEAERRQREKEQRAIEKAAAEKKKELQRKEEARQKAESERLLKIKKDKEEKQRQAEIAKKKELEQKESQRKEQLEKEKKAREAEKIAEQQKKKKLEQERQLEEAMRVAEQERLVRAAEQEEARRREQLERQQALSAQRQADASEVDRFMGLIKQRIEQKWHKPPNLDAGIQVVIRLSLAPTGELVRAEIAKKSGNSAFDQSALSAVYAVGRFPVPESSRVFEEKFRNFNLSFNPKD